MTTTTIRLQVPQTRTAPRAATRLGEFFAAAIALLSHRSAPTRNPVREAAYVRGLARQYEATDPSFASELYAAADRHEMLYGN
ncbi:MAG: hypothetical protein ABI605_01820 [Rhizobacter sp.]